MLRRYGFQVTDWFVVGLLAIEALLFTSERFGWFGFGDKKGWPVLIATGMLGLAILLLLLWLIASLLFWRRFQFSLKAVLLLVLAVAVPCGWLVFQRDKAARQRAAIRAIRDAGMTVYYRKNGNVMTSEPPGPIGLVDHLSGEFFSDADRVQPASLPRDPFSTDPRVQQFTDDDVVLLIEGVPNAKQLDLSGTQVTDAGLAHLKRFKHLEDLILDRTPITDAGLAHLKGLTTLQSLDLSQTEITDAGLSHLDRFTRLRSLLLEDTQVDGSGLKHLEKLTSLEWLVLDNTRTNDAALEHVSRHANLYSLNLQGTKVTDAGILHLKGLSNLIVLRLGGTGITGESIDSLAGLSELEYLDLFDTMVSGTKIEKLKGLTKLRVLILPTDRVTSAEMERLREALPNCQVNSFTYRAAEGPD